MSESKTISGFPATKLGEAKAALAKLHARLVRAAAKSGQTAPDAPSISVLRTYILSRCTACGCFTEGYAGGSCIACKAGYLTSREVLDLSLTAPKPALAGWEFLAVVEPLEGGNLIKKVPGADADDFDVSPWYTGAVVCDHCKTVRDRKETFLVRSTNDNDAYPAGCVRQVGRNCLADFLGGKSPAAILASLTYETVVSECGDEDGGCWGGRSRPVFAPAAVLAVTAAVVRLNGWTSKKVAAERGTQATADFVSYLLHPPTAADSKWTKAVTEHAPTDSDNAKGVAALVWASGLPGASDYERNLSLLARQTTVDSSKFGFLCSTISGYERFLGTQVERAVRATSEFVGTVGERIVVTVTVEKVFDVETDYGTLHINKFRDAAGNGLVWKTTSARFDVGKTVTLKGTVKKQDEYKGEKQTELSRCSECEPGEKVSQPKKRAKKIPTVPATTDYYDVDENGAYVRNTCPWPPNKD